MAFISKALADIDWQLVFWFAIAAGITWIILQEFGDKRGP